MHMLYTELQKMPHHKSSVYRTDKFSCIWWKGRTFPELGEASPEFMMAFFERGRGVLTGGVEGFEHIYNDIFKSIPDCGRGSEFRDPTPAELHAEKQDAMRAEIQRTLRKRKAESANASSAVKPPLLLASQTANPAQPAIANSKPATRAIRRYKRVKMAFDPHADQNALSESASVAPIRRSASHWFDPLPGQP